MGFSLRKLFGGSPTSASFTLPDKEIREKINKLTAFAESDITGPSQAGQIALDRLREQQELAQGGLAERQQQQLATGMSNQALFGGGSSAGSAERLARGSQQQGIQSQQELFSGFGGIRSEALQSDLANEQARRDRARDQAMAAEQGIFSARTSAELARSQMQAQRDAEKAGRTGRALGALGGIFGGQRGASAGSFIGGGFT